MRSNLFMVLRVIALTYGGMVLLLFGCQRRMMYFPTRVSERDAQRMASLDGLAPWRDDGGMLIGWKATRSLDRPDALLLFHGNAGQAVHRAYFAHGFAPHLAVYLFEYPGYGPRPGRPSEATFIEAGAAALAQLRRERPDGRIFLGGESLGTGVACRLAGMFPDEVAGLFLATPFSSLVDVARSHYPMFPVRWFMRDRYDSQTHVKAYRGPAVFLLAGRDEVVPLHLGEELYDAYPGPKKRWIQADRSHNTLDYSSGHGFWAEAAAFLLGE